MGKRSLVKIAAAFVSVCIHVAVAISLSQDFNDAQVPATLKDQMLQVTLNASSAQTLPQLSQASAVADESKIAQAVVRSDGIVAPSTLTAADAPSAPVPEDEKQIASGSAPGAPEQQEAIDWADWLPQLSNAPLPFALGQQSFPAATAYLPGRELDVRPAPEASVIVPFPEGSNLQGRVAAILVLFVSAEGAVDHVEIEDSELPPAFEKAAVETFMQVRMRPGIKDGRQMPSRIKIEVEFEAK